MYLKLLKILEKIIKKVKIFKVLITERALNDMNDIYDYLVKITESTKLAMSQYDMIANAINSLTEFPYRYTLADSIENNKNIRKLCIGNYLVFYLIIDFSVIILAVLYSASNIKEQLKKRLS